MDVRDGNLFLQLLPLLSLFLGCCLYGLCCNHNGDEGVEETEIERRVQEDKKWVLYEKSKYNVFSRQSITIWKLFILIINCIKQYTKVMVHQVSALLIRMTVPCIKVEALK